MVPQLKDRRLPPKPEKPAVWHYKYEVCEKTFLGICTKKKVVEDEFDTNDPKTWKTFVDMGASITFERRWQ